MSQSNSTAEARGVAGPPFQARDLATLLMIFFLALAIRVTYVLQMRASPLFEHPILDAAYHDEWARAIATGSTFIDGPYFRAPLYPWLLGVIYTVCGPGFLVPRLVQSVGGALSCGLVFLIGRLAFGRFTAALAGLAAATYWMLCYFDGELLIESQTVLLNLVMLWLILRATQRQTAAPWLLAGLALGLSAITRPNVLVFIPFVLLTIRMQARNASSIPPPSVANPESKTQIPGSDSGSALAAFARPAVLRHALAFLVGCLLPIVPVTVRNYVVGGDLVLISSQGGVNFFIGNNPQSDGVTAVVPGTPADWWGGYFAAIRMAEDAAGRSLKASEVSQYFFRRGLQFWADEPFAALNLLLHKLRLFWTARELGNNEDPHYFAPRFAPLMRFLPLTFGLVAPLAWVGLFLSWRHWRRLFPLWTFVAVWMASTAAFFVNARFRIPVVPILLLFAAAAVAWGVQQLRQRAFAHAGMAVVLTAAFAIVFNVLTASATPTTSAHSCHILSSAHFARQEYDLAIDYAQQWLALEPHRFEPQLSLAQALAGAGRRDDAITILKDVLRRQPGLPPALRLLATCLADDGRHGEAIDLLRAQLRAQPKDLGAATRLAWFLATAPQASLRNGHEALQLAQRVRDATHGRVAEPLDALAAAYAELGRFDEAIEVASVALALARAQHQRTLAAELELRLARYRQHQPAYE